MDFFLDYPRIRHAAVGFRSSPFVGCNDSLSRCADAVNRGPWTGR